MFSRLLRRRREKERTENAMEGVTVVEGVAPKAGTVLDHKRISENLYNLNHRSFGAKDERDKYIERLENALRFYADESNWQDGRVEGDKGYCANAALSRPLSPSSAKPEEEE